MTMGQILEVAQLQDVNRHVEELLGYLRLSMTVEPLTTVQCVRQVRLGWLSTMMAAAGAWAQLPVSEKCKDACVHF